jgi:hypothetical protein
MKIVLGLWLAARVLGAWALGLAILWALFLTGMGGPEVAAWMLTLLAALSGPFVLLAAIACLALPQRISRRPVRLLICALVLAAAVGAFLGGPVGAVYALSASIPGVILYLLAVCLWPIRAAPGAAAAH